MNVIGSNQKAEVFPRFELQFLDNKLEDFRFHCCESEAPRSFDVSLEGSKAFSIILLCYAASKVSPGDRFLYEGHSRNSPGRTLSNALDAEVSKLKDVLVCQTAGYCFDEIFPRNKPASNRSGKNEKRSIILWINSEFLPVHAVIIRRRSQGRSAQVEHPNALLQLAHEVWRTQPVEWTFDDPLKLLDHAVEAPPTGMNSPPKTSKEVGMKVEAEREHSSAPVQVALEDTHKAHQSRNLVSENQTADGSPVATLATDTQLSVMSDQNSGVDSASSKRPSARTLHGEGDGGVQGFSGVTVGTLNQNGVEPADVRPVLEVLPAPLEAEHAGDSGRWSGAKLFALLAACVLLWLSIALLWNPGSSDTNLTLEEKELIANLQPAFRGEKEKVFNLFSALKTNVWLEEATVSASFPHGNYVYRIPIVYAATLHTSVSSLRFDPESKSIISDSVAVVFDKERTLLMPVESERIENPSQRYQEGPLGKFNRALEQQVLEASRTRDLRNPAISTIRKRLEERITEALKPVLASGVEVKIRISE